jgi:hypothetical protein
MSSPKLNTQPIAHQPRNVERHSERCAGRFCRAYRYVSERNAALVTEYRLGQYVVWNWRHERSEVILSAPGRRDVIAHVHYGVMLNEVVLPTYCSNPRIDPEFASQIGDLWQSETRDASAAFDPAMWPAHDASLKLCASSPSDFVIGIAPAFKAQGVCRVPHNCGVTYFILGSVRWADEPELELLT